MTKVEQELKCIQVLLFHLEGEAYDTKGKYHLTLDAEDNVVVTFVPDDRRVTDEDELQRVVVSYDDLSIVGYDVEEGEEEVTIDGTLSDDVVIVKTVKRNGIYLCTLTDDEADVELGTVAVDTKNHIMVSYDETDEDCIDILSDLLELY